MRSSSYLAAAVKLAPFALCLAFLPSSPAQTSGGVLSVATPSRITGKRGEVLVIRLNAQLRPGYHVNSNTPSEDYLIPLRLTWEASPLQTAEVVFPSPHLEKYSFSPKPISVFTGDFEILTRMRIPTNAAPGLGILAGKLRYQACNDKMCFPPKTVEVRVPYDIR